MAQPYKAATSVTYINHVIRLFFFFRFFLGLIICPSTDRHIILGTSVELMAPAMMCTTVLTKFLTDKIACFMGCCKCGDWQRIDQSMNPAIAPFVGCRCCTHTYGDCCGCFVDLDLLEKIAPGKTTHA